jgi:cation diffusion facilitator CzcD-associated flavoprotein CzcO
MERTSLAEEAQTMPDTAILHSPASNAKTEHFDVLIVGAGISGIGGAYHLQQQCPGKSFVILEAQDSFGGTWWTHKYPGIRSDSDLYTFGYRFKPWTGAPIATAEEIRKYMGEVIEENGIEPHIRYHHRIATAAWSSAENLWTIEARVGDSGEVVRFTANFLWMCQGYYRHEEGYTPNWPGMDRFQGRIVHPQTWPTDLDYTDKTVIVIGSGATAATVVPAMAPTVSARANAGAGSEIATRADSSDGRTSSGSLRGTWRDSAIRPTVAATVPAGAPARAAMRPSRSSNRTPC